MNIISVNSGLDAALSALGHRVLSLRIDRPGLYALEPLLEERRRDPQWTSFVPEAVFQQEWLGKPVLLSDLRRFPVPRMFWSIDSHLNLYWHRHYAGLFDVVGTPHLSWWNSLPAHWRLPRVRRLAAAGRERPWRPHGSRKNSVGFVGRLSGSRALRTRLVGGLKKNFDAIIHDNLAYAEMLDFYTDVRVVPNESIAFEVNFRMMEAASCGCCVLSPRIGEDQDALFEPGSEVLLYGDMLEFEDLLRFCLRKPRMAEAVALAAHRRVNAAHLLRNRAEVVSRELAEAPCSTLSEAEAGARFWLAIAQLRRNKVMNIPAEILEKHLIESCPATPPVLTARVYLAAESHSPPSLPDELLHACLDEVPPAQNEDGMHAQELADLFTACGSVAVQARDFPQALVFWDRYCSALREPNRRAASLAELCVFWADSLGRRGLQCQPGLLFDPNKHCQTALDMALLASHLDGLGTAWAESLLRLDKVKRRLPELTLGALARLTLHEAHDWRSGLEYARTCLRCFRKEEGLDELHRALSEAAAHGETENCLEQLRKEGASHILTRFHPDFFIKRPASC